MNKLAVLSWGFVVAIVVTIFIFSSQVSGDSDHVSLGVAQWVNQWLGSLNGTWYVEPSLLNHYVRKAAHFSVYCLLGGALSVALRRINRESWWLPILLACLYAISDEFHQSFVPGRGPLATDVMIDTMGASLGVLIYRIFRKGK